MTRLIEDWIEDISDSIGEYEHELKSKSGYDYAGLAAAACGLSPDTIRLASACEKAAVIPVTTGLGEIGSFSGSVAAILRHMNIETFVTQKTDVAGIYEAHQKGASILFLADDQRFIAVNLTKNRVAENSQATAWGYAAALEGAVGSLKGKEVLVIGCGEVGRHALHCLKHKGAVPVAHDIDERVLAHLSDEGFKIITDTGRIREYPLMIDASSEGNWIHKGMLHPEAWVVTPGVPLSLTPEAYEFHRNRVIHDYLQIGVAVMLAMVCRS